MQVMNANVQQAGTCARPAFGSAFLAGQVVSVTVPTLTMSDGLLAIGDEWSALRVSEDDPIHSTNDTHQPAGARRQ